MLYLFVTVVVVVTVVDVIVLGFGNIQCTVACMLPSDRGDQGFVLLLFLCCLSVLFVTFRPCYSHALHPLCNISKI